MLADEKVGISSVCTPTHGTIYDLPVSKIWQEPTHGLSNACLRGVWVAIGGMAGVRPRNRDELGMCGAKWLMFLEVSESWKLIAGLDDTISVGIFLACVFSVWRRD
jgi:hypothetical protein